MNPFFEIEKEPLWIFDSGGDSYEVPNKYAIVNNESGAVLGIVSESYKPVKNIDVYNLFNSALKNVKIEKEIHHLGRDGRKWNCDFIINDGNTYDVTGDGDIIGILIRAFNSYDGKNTFGYEIMGYRWVCENGQIFGKRSLFVQSFKHFIGNADKLISDFNLKIKLFAKNIDQWKKWTSEEFYTDNLKDFLEDKKYVGKRLNTYIVDTHLSKHLTTKWDAYNLFTEIATHKTKSKKSDGVFTLKYRIMTKLIEDFYDKAA